MRWRSLAGTGPGADRWWEVLRGGYSQTHRRYHGMEHVDRVTADVEQLLVDHGSSHGLIDDDAVRLAAWFHDVVYDARATAGANEEASADLGAEAAIDLGFGVVRAGGVAALIRTTATHDADSVEAAVLLDADLAVLGAPPKAYAAYVAGVRAEYVHVHDDGWRVGRAGVLRSFLDRSVIYRTASMASREAQARANLTAELADLGEAGARLPG